MERHVIFLEGSVGVGKTTLGRALARRLSGHFLDGDAFSERGKPWYASILRTSRAIVETGLERLGERPTLVVAYPLRCTNWIYFRRRFTDAGVRPHFVGLTATYDQIVADRRGRVFDPDEQARIRTMIAEGYGARPFSDLVCEMGTSSVHETLTRLERDVRGLIDTANGRG